MKTYLPKVFIFLAIIFIVISSSQKLLAQTSSLILINEIQVTGTPATDEFVELFNPNNYSVDLTGWKLTRINSGNTENNLVDNFSTSIPAYSYLLITHNDYNGTVMKDISYTNASYNIANNHTVVLKDNNLNIIDLVGLGTALQKEQQTTANPPANSSIERVNHQDTNNNFVDFVINNSPTPQNKTSSADLPNTSPSPTPLVSPSPETSPSPSPTLEPSSTPQPSSSPTSQPSSSPTIEPSPSNNPSPTPETFPSSTPSTLPTPSASVFPSPLPTPTEKIIYQDNNFVCKLIYINYKILWLNFYFPQLKCAVVK